MDMNEKLHSGVLYLPDDDDIINLQEKCLEKLYDFNMTRPREMEKRSAMLKDMFAEIGEECYIEPPLHANWGGHHVHFGNRYMQISISPLLMIHISMWGTALCLPLMLLLQRQVIRLLRALENTAYSITRLSV